MGDGKSSEKYRNFSVAFLKEAKEDIDAAEILLSNKNYSRSLAASQQCVEKSIKAILEMEKVFVAEHDLSAFFLNFVYNNKEYYNFKKETEDLLEILDYFEGEWKKSRYPREEKGKVVTTMETYKEENAVEAYDKTTRCYELTKIILKKKFNLEIK